MDITINKRGGVVKEGYKQTEVGVIPEDWDCIPAGDAIEFFGGYGFSSRAMSNSGVRCLKIANVGVDKIKWEAEAFLPKSYLAEFKDYSLNLGDVVMALTRPILNDKLKVSQLNKSDLPSLLNQRVAKLKPKINSEIEYLFYIVQRLDFVASMNLAMAGTDPPNIGSTALNKICIPLPPTKTEQTVIAKALSDTDALIQSLSQLIAKKRHIKQGAMQQLLNPYDECRELKAGWVLKTYADAFNFLSTASYSRNDLSVSDDYGYVHYGDIHTRWDGFLDLDKHTLPSVSFQQAKKYSFLKNGDVIMADASEDYDGIGKSVEVKEIGNKQVISGLHTFLLRDKNDFFVNGFKGYIHSSKFVKSQFDRLATGLKVYGVSKTNLKLIDIPVPPKNEQTQVAKILTDMDIEITALENKRAKYQQIKQGMMQNLLTGRIRLI